MEGGDQEVDVLLGRDQRRRQADGLPVRLLGEDAVVEQLLEHGVLAKEAHGQTVRLAPPLVASEEDIDLLVDAFRTICDG